MTMNNARAVSHDWTRAATIGAISGAAVGLAAGLLLAPKKGIELRSDLMNSALRFRKHAGRAYERAAGFIRHTSETAR